MESYRGLRPSIGHPGQLLSWSVGHHFRLESWLASSFVDGLVLSSLIGRRLSSSRIRLLSKIASAFPTILIEEE
jgi:hypothetical protein